MSEYTGSTESRPDVYSAMARAASSALARQKKNKTFDRQGVCILLAEHVSFAQRHKIIKYRINRPWRWRDRAIINRAGFASLRSLR